MKELTDSFKWENFRATRRFMNDKNSWSDWVVYIGKYELGYFDPSIHSIHRNPIFKERRTSEKLNDFLTLLINRERLEQNKLFHYQNDVDISMPF